jgi:hypothetical protein
MCYFFDGILQCLTNLHCFRLGLEKRWREKAVAADLKEILAEEDVRSVLLKSSTESVVWLNRTLRCMWPHLDRWLSASTTSFLMRALVGVNQPDEYGKPKSVQFDVKYVSFGSSPLTIDGITTKQPTEPYSVRLDLDFTFRGDIVVELEAALSFMKIPLTLNDLEMRGKLKLEMSFKDRGSIKLLSVAFLGAPTLNFSIKTIGKLDVMDLPTLKSSINTVIVAYMRSSMTFPNALKFDWSGGHTSSPNTPSTEEERASLQRTFTHQTVSALDIETETQKLQATGDVKNETTLSSAPLPSTPNSLNQSGQHPLSQTLGPELRRQSSETNMGKTSQSSSQSTLGQNPVGSGGGGAVPSTASSSGSIAKKPMPRTNQPLMRKKEEDVNEFLLMSPEEFTGTLRVRVVECSKLASSDIFSVSPYVVLETNGVTYQTAVVKRTAVPSWNNALYEFPIPKYLPPKGLILKLQVFDKSKIGPDESLGHVQVNLNAYLAQPDEQFDFWVPLVDTTSGKVRLQCKYIPE